MNTPSSIYLSIICIFQLMIVQETVPNLRSTEVYTTSVTFIISLSSVSIGEFIPFQFTILTNAERVSRIGHQEMLHWLLRFFFGEQHVSTFFTLNQSQRRIVFCFRNSNWGLRPCGTARCSGSGKSVTNPSQVTVKNTEWIHCYKERNFRFQLFSGNKVTSRSRLHESTYVV